MGALLRTVDSPALSNLTPEELAALAGEGYPSQIAVADAQTMRDQTALFVDFNELNGQAGRAFRSIPSAVEPIVANLSLANTDSAEFALQRRQPPTAPDRMNARTRGKRWQNSPPPHESTSPPARSIASHRGSADRTKSSAVAASTSSTAHTSATISRRLSDGRSASKSRSTVKRYARPAARVLIWRSQCATRPQREPVWTFCTNGQHDRQRPAVKSQVKRYDEVMEPDRPAALPGTVPPAIGQPVSFS